jgi:hypothetical protein
MDLEQDVAADPSPAPVETTIVAPTRALADLSDVERLEWRKTGIFPDAPAASSTATADKPAATAATSDPDSAPDDPDYKPKTKARIAELLAENKRLKAAQAAPPVAPPVVKPVAASTLAKPDPEKFTYGTADPAYLEALTDYKVADAREKDRVSAAAESTNAHNASEAARIRDSWQTRVEDAKTVHTDFEKVAFAPFKPGFEIPMGSAMDAWILESDHGAEVLYALQKNPAEIKRLLALGPIAQTRALVQLEDTAIAARTVKTKTTAPEPGPLLGVRAGDPASPVARALKSRDFPGYRDAANREEIARKKGQ